MTWYFSTKEKPHAKRNNPKSFEELYSPRVYDLVQNLDHRNGEP